MSLSDIEFVELVAAGIAREDAAERKMPAACESPVLCRDSGNCQHWMRDRIGCTAAVGCRIESTSSRMCERGTKACVVEHGKKEGGAR